MKTSLAGVLSFVLFSILALPATSAQTKSRAVDLGTISSCAPSAPLTAPYINDDSVMLADGTAVPIKVAHGFSSETAKAGDIISLSVAFDVCVDGLVVIPQGTDFAAKVSSVTRPRRGFRSGQVAIAFDVLTLPTGETATIRLIRNPASKRERVGDGAAAAAEAAEVAFFTAGVEFFALIEKGDEEVVPEGAIGVVYMNGPLQLSRKDLIAHQRSPASSFANIYVDPELTYQEGWDRSLNPIFPKLFCGERLVSESFEAGRVGSSRVPDYLLRLQLSPGSYWFSTDNPKDRPVRIDVVAGRKYYLDRNRHGPFTREITRRDYAWGLVDEDLIRLTPEEFRLLTAEPAVRENDHQKRSK